MTPARSQVRRLAVSLFRGNDKGTVAVTFLLSLPILLLMVGILTQYALLTNARLTVARAVAAAARAAMTSLPTDAVIDPASGVFYPQEGPNNAARAALLVLETISPDPALAGGAGGANAESPVSDDALALENALEGIGVTVPQGFADRYSYAQSASTITITPNGGNATYAQQAGGTVHITVTYNFELTVPGVKSLIGQAGTIAGISGRFQTMTSSLDVQLSPGRETPSGNDGSPQ